MISRTLDGRKIDLMSAQELRAELRAMIAEAARLEKGAKCFHEDMRSVSYRDADDPSSEVTMYTCRDCKLSWKETS